MLADPRAEVLVTQFRARLAQRGRPRSRAARQAALPGVHGRLREDFAEEIELFLGSVLLEDENVQSLLTADYTFLNERLARHYGVASVVGPQFRRVVLEDKARHGLLGKGAVLLRTSYGDRTSPVLRGAWVLDKLMGTPPTPPPPGVETNLSTPAGEQPKTLRARLEQHRANSTCKACHGVIDPFGLALENFTATGRWRDHDAGPMRPSTRAPSCRAASPSRPRRAHRGATRALRSVRAGADAEAHDVCGRAASSSTTTCRRCAPSCGPRQRRIIGFPRSSRGSSEATRSACRR